MALIFKVLNVGWCVEGEEATTTEILVWHARKLIQTSVTGSAQVAFNDQLHYSPPPGKAQQLRAPETGSNQMFQNAQLQEALHRARGADQ